MGAEKRLALIARDIVDHFESRLEAMDGKAMVVCMSRRICIDLSHELVRLRPDREEADDSRGRIKIVMTGAASDPPDWQPHIRNKLRREALARRFRDPGDPLRMVLVRDMWLTGFDAPSLHTMYVDKPMRAHGLMQAVARVNRVFRDKPGGLVVDDLGLAHELKQALGPTRKAAARGGVRRTRRKRWPPCGRNTRSAVACFTVSTTAAGSTARLRRACPCCRRRRNTSWPGGRQGAMLAGGERTVPGLRPCRTA